MKEQYVSRHIQEVWHSNHLTHGAVRTSSRNIVHQEFGVSCFAERSSDNIEIDFTIIMSQKPLEGIRKWINVEGVKLFTKIKEKQWITLDYRILLG